METGRLINFERADAITTMMYPPHPVLVVSGQTPVPGMDVALVPVMYVSQPEYWAIQVVGSVSDAPRPMQPIAGGSPYRVELALTGVTGTKGVDVVGADQTERIDVPTTTEGA
jgi:hypothetical protein